ncbi:hypothetical protein FA13DRAFT_1303930 [Coprinellus micaceus]|uniref:Uncharacterized protein n=1 Tax=Coprinellus micaceus TaxID=71717 RepID=A0A4Y7SRW5_COPMI|nr:hypothetical protein FA13DRAFT_1303930 [Coprinellus micaceus]
MGLATVKRWRWSRRPARRGDVNTILVTVFALRKSSTEPVASQKTIRWPRSGTGILVMLKARLEVADDVGASKGAEDRRECTAT